MFQDLRKYQDGVAIETDICVVGAGAAGITLALELSGSGHEVLLVESGDRLPEGETLALNQGPSIAEPYPPLETTRLRYFGGTTNHWDGHCRPLDPIDFEKRDWVPHSGWPIGYDTLEPFYARAQKICELGPYDYEADHWKSALPGLIDFAPERMVNRLWQFSPPTRFGERYARELEEAAEVQVLLNANVVDIEVNDAATKATSVQVRTIEGKSGHIKANTVVLAAGGIENPRILLACNRRVGAGLGNQNDVVGRFFQEHPHALIAYAIPQQDIERLAPYFRGVPAQGERGEATIRAKAGLSEALQRSERLPNACTDIGYGHDRSSGFLSLQDVYNAVERGSMPDHLDEAMIDMVTDIGGLAGGLYRWMRGERVLWFGANAEQIPNPDSRVTLASERDAVGMPRPKLAWRLTELDKIAVRRCCEVVGEELARLGIARMRLDDWLLEQNGRWEDLQLRYHHIGTTRMSDDPKQGVVDANAKVHGIDNLYVAGSSVFPTSGYANPTLTIVALSARLAHHLSAKRS